MATLANIKVEPCNVSWGGEDIGFLDGEIEVSTEETGAEITAHQEGSNILDMIRTGKNVELSMTLKEFDSAQFQRIFGAGGAVATAAPEITEITTVADVAGSLNNKYFFINTAGDSIEYYVWFNVNSAGVDPAPAGKTEVEVALATGATAAQVASAIQSALDALAGFSASVVGSVVTVTNATNGGTTDAEDFNAGFTFEVTQQGVDAVYGWGKSKDFTGVTNQAQKLVLHPVVLADSVMTRDLAFWLAYPMPESITFSGEDPLLVSVTFKIFPDFNRAPEVRLFVRGNHL